MVALVHQDIAYSYKRYTSIIALPNDDDARTLASIESLLVDAANAYRERRYLDAIDSYNSARRLLWSQIQPTVFYDDVKIRDLDLLTTFVSLGNEWLNVLPVEAPVAGVRPREEIAVDAGPLLGLRSSAVSAEAAGAVADMHLADTLERRGNTGAAQFFKHRAESLAPDLINSMEVANAPDRDGPIDLAFEAHRVSIEDAVVARLDRPIALAAALNGMDDAPVVVTIPPKLTVDERSYAFRSNGEVKTVTWAAGDVAKTEGMLGAVYEARKELQILPDILLAPQRPADVAVALAHAWQYETALGLAECYHALGDWVAAEPWYLTAAKYEYLNAAVEAPFVWGRIATLYLDWGNSLFRDDDAAAAKAIYERVLLIDGREPVTDLYTIAGLAPGAVAARDVIAHLGDAAQITASPTIAAVVLDIWAQLSKIAGGLDFWGHWSANVPIWTFDYLQSVALTFCQLAVGAERDAMTFWEKADLGQLTRTQLVQNVAQTKAERAAAQRQVDAAVVESQAFVAGEETAKLRARNAQENADEYEDKSWDWTLHQAQSAQLAGGSDGNSSELNRLADRIQSGSYHLSGERGTLSAAEQLAASRIQREYEVDSLRRQAEELASAQNQATLERQAAEARVRASQASLDAANVRVAGAQELVAAFDQQRFTPDVWHALGEKMSELSNRYLVMALDVAKRMQRAYNFENDVALAMIKADYSSDAVHGLLAADTLLADVQSFTYDLIVSSAPKPQPIQQTVSLAERYPFLFETQFRPNGTMEFQTTLDDFDERYPGTYAGRITHVEVQVDGIVPPRGLSGTLMNAGISQYRTPALAGTGIKHRVQSRETLVLSDFDVRADALMVDDDRRLLRVFEGAGVASTWTLSLPKEVNDLDYDAITDVRLTFTYEGRFDPDLRDTVIQELATRPQANERQRPLPLRWLYPDAFFAFYERGELEITLAATDFPAPQTKPKIAGLSLIAVTTPRARADGIVLRVKVPGHAAITVTTGSDGTVAADDLAAVVGENVLGDWKIELRAADNPSWVTDGVPALDAIDNLSLVLGYSFTPRS